MTAGCQRRRLPELVPQLGHLVPGPFQIRGPRQHALEGRLTAVGELPDHRDVALDTSDDRARGSRLGRRCTRTRPGADGTVGAGWLRHRIRLARRPPPSAAAPRSDVHGDRIADSVRAEAVKPAYVASLAAASPTHEVQERLLRHHWTVPESVPRAGAVTMCVLLWARPGAEAGLIAYEDQVPRHRLRIRRPGPAASQEQRRRRAAAGGPVPGVPLGPGRRGVHGRPAAAVADGERDRVTARTEVIDVQLVRRDPGP